MVEEVVIGEAESSKDIMENPKVMEAVSKVLERKLAKPLSPKHEWGWKQVQEGRKCVFPDCRKKSETAAFHGYPLCREHHDLAQWIGIIIYDCVYNEDDPETLASKLNEIELVVSEKLKR